MRRAKVKPEEFDEDMRENLNDFEDGEKPDPDSDPDEEATAYIRQVEARLEQEVCNVGFTIGEDTNIALHDFVVQQRVENE